ncbi:MAG: hypothetical protein JXA49_05705 [Actinobacteria bacterium]|nr:hypothetical protein [Actinomycetota bacterium]
MMNRKFMGTKEIGELLNRNEQVKKAVQDLRGEEVIVSYGKGTRRKREVRGTISKTSKEIFLVESEKRGQQVSEAFRYKDLIIGNFSITLQDTGAEVLPELSGL